jgi:serine O-acetyltransferase
MEPQPGPDSAATPAPLSARQRWRADLRRYLDVSHHPDGPLKRIRVILVTEGLWAIAVYRFGQHLREEAPPLLRWLLRVPYELVRKMILLGVGIYLNPTTRIGPGFYISHFGGIWINPMVVIGSRCTISHGVTIGAPLPERGAPVLGDRVWIGAGAVITGPVRIESGVVVGANSLVTSSLPENAVAVGVPARVVAHTGSANLLGMWDRKGGKPPV